MEDDPMGEDPEGDDPADEDTNEDPMDQDTDDDDADIEGAGEDNATSLVGLAGNAVSWAIYVSHQQVSYSLKLHFTPCGPAKNLLGVPAFPAPDYLLVDRTQETPLVFQLDESLLDGLKTFGILLCIPPL